MSTTPENDTLLLAGDLEPVAGQCDLAGGTVLGSTRRAPEKPTGNEDAALAMPFGEDAAVLAVADGAGGLPAGQRASNTAIAALRDSLADSCRSGLQLRIAVLNGIEAANQAILGLSNGSATTLTVVGIEDDHVRAFHVGDSPALLVGQKGRIKLQTIAHSPTGFAVEAGFLDEADALFHEDRHVVSNFVGSPDMRIEIGPRIGLSARDTLLVASDGLTDNLHVGEIVERIRRGSPRRAMNQLMESCAERMCAHLPGHPSKPDDLTVLLFRRNRPRLGRQMASAASSAPAPDTTAAES